MFRTFWEFILNAAIGNAVENILSFYLTFSVTQKRPYFTFCFVSTQNLASVIQKGTENKTLCKENPTGIQGIRPTAPIWTG